MVQWLKRHFPMQWARVRSPVGKTKVLRASEYDHNLKTRETEKLGRDHTAIEWQAWASVPCLATPPPAHHTASLERQ